MIHSVPALIGLISTASETIRGVVDLARDLNEDGRISDEELEIVITAEKTSRRKMDDLYAAAERRIAERREP